MIFNIIFTIYFCLINAMVSKYIGGGIIPFFFGKGRRMFTAPVAIAIGVIPIWYTFGIYLALSLGVVAMLLQITFRTGEIGHMFMLRPWYNEIEDREQFSGRLITTSYGRFLSKMPNAYVAYMIRVGLQLFIVSLIIYFAIMYFYQFSLSWRVGFILFLSVWAGTCYPLSGLLEENKTARIKDGMIIHVSNAQNFWAEIEIGGIIGLLALELVIFR